MSSSYPTISFGVLLFPGFEVLDVAGPLEALNTLSRMEGHQDMTLSILARTMDPIDPSPPNSKGMGFQKSQRYLPTHTLDDTLKIDVLLVPGGFGSLPPSDTKAEVEFIRKVYRGDGCDPLQYLITVCTGAGLAAQAGVLDGHSATTNKSVWKLVTQFGPRTYWVGHARWVVSKNIWTTSGVSAGTDGMIAWLAHVFPEKVVEHVVNAMEYNREKDAWNDPFSKIFGVQDVAPIGW